MRRLSQRSRCRTRRFNRLRSGNAATRRTRSARTRQNELLPRMDIRIAQRVSRHQLGERNMMRARDRIERIPRLHDDFIAAERRLHRGSRARRGVRTRSPERLRLVRFRRSRVSRRRIVRRRRIGWSGLIARTSIRQRRNLNRRRASAIRPAWRLPDSGAVAERTRSDRLRWDGTSVRRIVKIEGRTVEARHVCAAAPDCETGNDGRYGRCGLEAETPAVANAKTIHHGTHLYSHHPLTFNRLTSGKRFQPDLPQIQK